MNYSMTEAETRKIDSVVEQMIDNLQGNQALTEQMALDSVRLLSCTEDNYKKLQNQGFFKRCWSRMSGVAGKLERENTHSLIEMQKIGYRYINMLQQNQLLAAHSILTLKNNLNALAVKDVETQKLIADLANATNERFLALERRLDECETNVNLQGWLLTLEERELDTLYPTPHIRMLEVINQFYQNKSDNWNNNNDLLFMKKALRTVGIDPKQIYSIKDFISSLMKEIISEKQFNLYEEELNRYTGSDNSQFIIEEISSPIFATMHSVKSQYEDRMESVNVLRDDLNTSPLEAITKILYKKIEGLNVNIEYKSPLAESAIEILGSMRLANLLEKEKTEEKEETIESSIHCPNCNSNLIQRSDGNYYCKSCGNKYTADDFIYNDAKPASSEMLVYFYEKKKDLIREVKISEMLCCSQDKHDSLVDNKTLATSSLATTGIAVGLGAVGLGAVGLGLAGLNYLLNQKEKEKEEKINTLVKNYQEKSEKNRELLKEEIDKAKSYIETLENNPLPATELDEYLIKNIKIMDEHLSTLQRLSSSLQA